MPRLNTRPPIFRGRSALSTTNGVSSQLSNGDLFGRDTSNVSFDLDSYRSGIKSTQQLSIDFSKFENHAFFTPARAKVDVAFYKILNQFPYTGSQADVDQFLSSLTGFERYVYDNHPKNMGYLFFSGASQAGSTHGTHIRVSPYSGNSFPDVPGATGQNHVDIGTSPFEIETHLYVPDIVNDVQIITQRSSSNAAYTLALKDDTSVLSCSVMFLVSSASDSYLIASGTIQKGKFNHIRAKLGNESDGKRALIYVDGTLIASSSDIQDFGALSFTSENILIGSGTQHFIIDYSINPQETLSGALDDFRFYVGDRPNDDVEKYDYRSTSASSLLKLYFKFDEPSGSHDYNDVVLDHSGRCLHSYVQNYKQALRNTGSLAVPIMQDIYYSPVLFADYDPVSSYAARLINSASSYDVDNPNIVTNLIPQHVLVESARASGLRDYDSGLGVQPSLESLPGTGEMPATSALLRMLCVLSNTSDEIKQYADSMSNLLAVELGDTAQVSDQMLPFVADYFGVDLPNFFAKSNTDQFVFGQDVLDDEVANYTLKEIRNLIWRRILANLPSIVASKGTAASIRSVFLSSGIVPENFFVIRELGLAGETLLDDKRDVAVDVGAMLDFSASLNTPTGSFVESPFGVLGSRGDSPRIISPFLSASRIETGYPYPSDVFVDKDLYPPHGIAKGSSNGLLTSGSFTFESSYVFEPNNGHPLTQSLVRFQTTSSVATLRQPLISNLVYTHATNAEGTLTWALCVDSLNGINPYVLNLELTGVNLFSGDKWHVGIVKQRNDSINMLTSSYTLRCARQVGTHTDLYTTSSYFLEVDSPDRNVLTNISTRNTSGSYFMIGSGTINTTGDAFFLNYHGTFEGRTNTNFTGKVSNIRFWSTDISEISFIEHARNPYNIGTDNPELGLGLNLVQTGAYQRLRVDANCDQATVASDSSGDIRIFDFSQNSLHLSGSGFEPSRTVIKPYRQIIDRISPRFDLQQVDNKVRVRGVKQLLATDRDYTVQGPAYEIYDTANIVDDVRYSIEHSVVKALNEDIVSTIGNVQYIDNTLGAQVDLYSDGYAGLDSMSSVYFNRLTSNIDLLRTYDVFRWVDTALSQMIESLLPKRTRFLGINYIIEPHLLERAKLKYYSDEMAIKTTGQEIFILGPPAEVSETEGATGS